MDLYPHIYIYNIHMYIYIYLNLDTLRIFEKMSTAEHNLRRG